VLEVHFVSSISMCTPSGTCIRITCLKVLSLASRSMILLCMRISHLSQVEVPSPSGLLRVVIFILRVGMDMGPANLLPIFLVMSIIWLQTSCIFFISLPISIIRAFSIVFLGGRMVESYYRRGVLKNSVRGFWQPPCAGFLGCFFLYVYYHACSYCLAHVSYCESS